jgi:hypothetical protein
MILLNYRDLPTIAANEKAISDSTGMVLVIVIVFWDTHCSRAAIDPHDGLARKPASDMD